MGHRQAGHFEAQIVCIFWRCYYFQRQNLLLKGIKHNVPLKAFLLQYCWIVCDWWALGRYNFYLTNRLMRKKEGCLLRLSTLYCQGQCCVHRGHDWETFDRWTNVKWLSETKYNIKFHAILTVHVCMSWSSCTWRFNL